jgi:hypothetical protein
VRRGTAANLLWGGAPTWLTPRCWPRRHAVAALRQVWGDSRGGECRRAPRAAPARAREARSRDLRACIAGGHARPAHPGAAPLPACRRHRRRAPGAAPVGPGAHGADAAALPLPPARAEASWLRLHHIQGRGRRREGLRGRAHHRRPHGAPRPAAHPARARECVACSAPARDRRAADEPPAPVQIDAKPSVPHAEGARPRIKKIFVGGLAPDTTEGARPVAAGSRPAQRSSAATGC